MTQEADNKVNNTFRCDSIDSQCKGDIQVDEGEKDTTDTMENKRQLMAL